VILRQMLEDVTGKAFHELMHEQVFEPVGMTHSSTWTPHTLPSFQFMKADRIRLHQYIRTFAAACAAVPDGFC
jgi:CubicO group peptidase (beta-lactamase class C family)